VKKEVKVTNEQLNEPALASSSDPYSSSAPPYPFSTIPVGDQSLSVLDEINNDLSILNTHLEGKFPTYIPKSHSPPLYQDTLIQYEPHNEIYKQSFEEIGVQSDPIDEQSFVPIVSEPLIREDEKALGQGIPVSYSATKIYRPLGTSPYFRPMDKAFGSIKDFYRDSTSSRAIPLRNEPDTLQQHLKLQQPIKNFPKIYTSSNMREFAQMNVPYSKTQSQFH